jgi:sigma-B regulation protein RsbU (phosphoserine phosphatase)
MRLLIADDDTALRHGLSVHTGRWGYQPVLCADGLEAQAVLRAPDPPSLAVLDWNMPGIDGLAITREIRSLPHLASTYVVLLTSHSAREQMVTGLDCGADEYMVKPVDWELLRARIRIGARIVTLQQSLAQRVSELQTALDTVKVLSGLLPMCSYCKRIRKDNDYWQQLECYLSEHTDAQFSHGVCPDCLDHAEKEFGLRS